MGLRRDALAGAAEAMVELERARGVGERHHRRHRRRAARAPRRDQRRARRGRLDVDVRDSDLPAREPVVDAILAAAREIAERRNLDVEVTPIVEDTPVACGALVVEAAERPAASSASPTGG